MKIWVALSLVLTVSCFGSSRAVESGIQATTEDGRKVILYPDGSWIYSPRESANEERHRGQLPQVVPVSEKVEVYLIRDTGTESGGKPLTIFIDEKPLVALQKGEHARTTMSKEMHKIGCKPGAVLSQDLPTQKIDSQDVSLETDDGAIYLVFQYNAVKTPFFANEWCSFHKPDKLEGEKSVRRTTRVPVIQEMAPANP